EQCKDGCSYVVSPDASKTGTVDVTASVTDPTGKQPGAVEYKQGNSTIIRLCTGTVGASIPPPSSSTESADTGSGENGTATPDETDSANYGQSAQNENTPAPGSTFVPTPSGTIETHTENDTGAQLPILTNMSGAVVNGIPAETFPNSQPESDFSDDDSNGQP